MLACNHDRPPYGSPLCSHLQTSREPWISYVRWYIGREMDFECLCVPCAEERARGGTVATAAICEECFAYVMEEVCDLTGIRGAAEVLRRPEQISDCLQRTVLPLGAGRIVDIAAISGDPHSRWLLLSESGAISRFDAESGEFVMLGAATVPAEPDHKPWGNHPLRQRLHASEGGEFAAVVHDYGRHGQVVDLATGRVTMALDGGNYHPETVPFSFAFSKWRNQVVAIHRTAWNRLDVSDPSTGALLTERGPTKYSQGEQRPKHYLDYFHGALHLSPSGQEILDDGWIWHPVGMIRAWSLEPWLSGNVWESEAGPSQKSVCARNYYWDHGIAWLDERRVAIAGIGDDDEAMLEGARIFDMAVPVGASTEWHGDISWRRELRAFAGPKGQFFSDGHWLYSSEDGGLLRWNFEDGFHTGTVSGFHPTHHHRGARELVELRGSEMLRWRTESVS